MVEPLIFITAITIKEGKLDTEVTSVQIHPDEDSMAFHMRVAQAYEPLETIKSPQTPSETFVEQMKPASEPEFPVIVKSKFGGFNRLAAEPAS